MTELEGAQAGSRPESQTRVLQVELLISNLLRIGVVASLSFVVAGTMLTFLHHPDYLSSPTALVGLTALGTPFPHTLPDILASVRDLREQGIVIVGLLLLIATPVMRVAVSIFAFTYQGNRVFAVITTVVLSLLILSFVLGQTI